MRRVFIKIIKLYKAFLSPSIGNHCRFYPSCSEYAIEAIEKEGAAKGIIKTISRVLRCNPFSAGGYDPVHKTIKFEEKFHG